ncbi:hypothetical protein QN277_018078 [Acacia crassicarpa]|uniref:Uncharacterized protein n=1 Tax=Acacia crassicarpa TaxID=499986 RepID=A0AAE1JVM2_9FABA|nr:hypothetical protein QN277_018078 [Acacia crassicarpa]
MEDCNMMEVDTKGNRFTWMIMREGEGLIRECLDRVVVNAVWKTQFQSGLCCVLQAIGSDHTPLLLDLEPKESVTPKSLGFDERWLMHPKLEEIVKAQWERFMKGVVV